VKRHMEYTTVEENDSNPYLSRLWSYFSSGNYPYVTARVRAKRAFLLSHETYDKLFMMDIHEITRYLGESRYKTEITELSLNYKGFELIERALHRNMAEVFHQILEFSEGDLHTMLAAFLEREDVMNFKTILRGKTYNAKNEEIMRAIHPAGKYPEEYWRGIIQQSKTLEETIDNFKGNEYYELLRTLQEEWHTNLAECENKLERQYYDNLLHSVRTRSEANTLFLDFIRREIDIINLKTLLMTKYKSVEPDKISTMMLPSGELQEKTMKRLVQAADFTVFLEELQKLPISEAMKDQLGTIAQTGSLTYVIRALEKEYLKRVTKSSYLHPLSILPVIDYLTRKRIEVENLCILARGKEKGLPDPVIREMMVM
jgi:V/A-type H+-transporting ATPase subunit C